MNKTFRQKALPSLAVAFFLAFLTVYILLDAFVIERPLEQTPITRDPSTGWFPTGTTAAPSTTAAPASTTSPATTSPTTSTTPVTLPGGSSAAAPESSSPTTTTKEPAIEYPIIGDLYYKDENIEIAIEEEYYLNENGVYTRLFIVDLKLSDIEYLRTAFAKEQYGYKIRETTTEIAERYDAVFAINGDYYGYRKDGFVLRNYELYRTEPRDEEDGDDALLVFNDGSLFMIDENEIPATSLPLQVYQCFSFGPALLENGVILVDEDSEVNQSAASNPRTAIGMIEPLHYKIVVSEGRLVKNDGLTLLELAEVMADLGCTTAYNLDGGSSTTLYFNGEVLNELSDDEREISDIIFINGKSYADDPN